MAYKEAKAQRFCPQFWISPPLWIPKNQRVFSVIICVKRIPCAAAYGGDHNPAAILQIFCIAAFGALITTAGLIPPVLPGVIDIKILRICHPNPQGNKKRKTNFPCSSIPLTILTALAFSSPDPASRIATNSK